MCRDVVERRVSSPGAVLAVYLLKDEGHVGPEEETTRGSCGTWAEGRKRTTKRYGRWGRTARGPKLEATAIQDSGRGAEAVLYFHTVARKAFRQLCTSMGTILVPEAILGRQDYQYPTNKDRQKLIPYYGFNVHTL